MKITLKSTNTKHYPAVEKTLLILPRENEILICTEDGNEIASLSICMVDKEYSNGAKQASKNFWLNFHPKNCFTSKNAADVIIEE